MEHEIRRCNTQPVYKCDVDSLRPGTWLNDGAVNWYMHLLYSSRQNSRFKVYPLSSYTYALMRNAHQKNELNSYKKLCEGHLYAKGILLYAKGIVFSDCDLVFFPIHKPGHWCLVVGYPKKLKLAYYDPMGHQDQ